MRIQQHLGRAFVVFFKYPWDFILSSLVAIVLSCATLGILAPVMWLGMGDMFLRANDGVKPSVEDLFKHLNKTLMLDILSLIIGLSVMIGGILLLIPGLIVAALWIYAPYYMAHKESGIMESLKLSSITANKHGLFAHVAIVVSLGLVLSIGFNTIIGAFVAYPLCAGFTAFLFGEVGEAQ